MRCEFIVKKAIIKSNVDGEEVDLRKCVEVHYEESLFSDSIEVNFIIANRAGTVRGLTLAEGLPLVGTEDFELHLQDPKNNVIKVKLNVKSDGNVMTEEMVEITEGKPKADAESTTEASEDNDPQEEVSSVESESQAEENVDEVEENIKESAPEKKSSEEE